MSESKWIITDQVFKGSMDEAVEQWVNWLEGDKTKYVCFANVHMTVEAIERNEFGQVLQDADMICADGQPLVWLNNRLNNQQTQRISGMDALPLMLDVAEEKGISCFFYGGTDEMLVGLSDWLSEKHSKLIYQTYSPPFGPLTKMNFEVEADRINDGAPKWIFVVLGCPKQEEWMWNMRDRIQGVMFGVGGALPVLIGMQKRAPLWMQKNGLEWLFRLIQEPRRMWKRYFWTNTVFLMWVLRLMLFSKKKKESC
jgi:N-acetylglucosaminyldiphosphoundecaprenol N-acetyl-beta-D-mannosaminyltransferase